MGTVRTQVVKFIRKGEPGEPGADAPVISVEPAVIVHKKSAGAGARYAVSVTVTAGGRRVRYNTSGSTDGFSCTPFKEALPEGLTWGWTTSGSYEFWHVLTVAAGAEVSAQLTFTVSYGGADYSRTVTVRTVADGDKGDPGDRGGRGAVMRGPQLWSDVADGYVFQAGGDGEQWLDVVRHGENYYTCKTTHRKTSANYPGGTNDRNGGLWQLGDKIDLVATKILLAAYALVENLGVTAVEMKDSAGSVVFEAKDGNVTCRTGTFENVTVSGTLKGVSGSFRTLNCVDDSGKVVGQIAFGADGRMWINDGDLFHQGTRDGRGLRLYASNIWCRGDFGSGGRNVLEVDGSYGVYRTKGVENGGVYAEFTKKTDSDGLEFYELEMYGQDGDASAFPVDTVVFRITAASVFRYRLLLGESQRVLLINANDQQNNAQIYVNGRLWTLNGGEMREVCQMRTLQYPQKAAGVLGAGLFLGAAFDNNFN